MRYKIAQKFNILRQDLIPTDLGNRMHMDGVFCPLGWTRVHFVFCSTFVERMENHLEMKKSHHENPI